MGVPTLDVHSVGAGGGSSVHLDAGGALRVGPRSAGADPGPVCYRRGGVEPTVTDANIVLGRLNPDYVLGGEIGLDVDGAARAIEERCAGPLGLSVTQAANGIVEIANAAMVNALHLISVQRGYDPRDFVLVGFGGAGPVHANALARDAEMPTLLIPRSPGIFSATGLLTTDLKRDAAVTMMRSYGARSGQPSVPSPSTRVTFEYPHSARIVAASRDSSECRSTLTTSAANSASTAV
jgi:N-methylhydantoinase A